MRQAKKIVVALLPEFAQKWIVTVRRRIISRQRATRRVKLRELSTEDLIKDLKSAGIAQGDTIMVHSSLSRIGNVQGGPDTVIKALMETVTQNGTILMPTYGSAEEIQHDHELGKILDLRTKESDSGIITERFRTWPNVFRSSHPFSSACAWGKNAEYITSGHSDDTLICHANSPFARLVELKGKVVGIGVSLGPVSIYHVIEDNWDKFPIKVYGDQFPVKYINASGNMVLREVTRYNPKVSVTRIDHKDGEWIREMLTLHLSKEGILCRFRFGDSDSWFMETQPLCAELKRLAEKGITIYLTRDKWISMNGGNESIDSW